MVKNYYLCTSCVQVLTNPICPNCFSSHTILWLRDRNLKWNVMEAIIQEFVDFVKEAEQTSTGINCIICGRKKVNLCTYCFTLKAERILVKRLEQEQIIKNFHEDFSTNIWRKV